MKICVYAICKNESQFVERWLNSMSEADYIVVLDTGSTDDTYKKLKADKRVTIARKQIIKPWRFDVARNESMKLVPEDADILVCTDLDEVFEPGWATILRENWESDVNRAFYTFAWGHNEIGEPTDIFKYGKIHDRHYHWVFPVHEVIELIDPAFKEQETTIDFKQDIFLHHYPDKTKERKYYKDLLELSVKENPDNAHVRMLYARELVIQKDLEGSLKEFLKVLEMPDVNNRRQVLLNSLLQVALIYEDLKNYDEGIWYCQEFIKEDPTFREPYLIMAEMYCNMNMPTLAEGCIEMAKKYSYRHYSWVERATTWTNLLEDIESVCQFKLGNYKEAYHLGKEALSHAPSDARLLENVNEFAAAYIEALEDSLPEQKEEEHESK